MSRLATESVSARAEKHIHDRLREALPPEFTLFQNVAWVVRDHGVEREGEADVIVAHPERGFLIIEVKSGPITRDAQGRWWAGGRPLDRAHYVTKAQLGGDSGELVAPAGPPLGTNQPRLPQVAKDLLQKTAGNALALSDVSDLRGLALAVIGEVEDRLHAVASLAREPHVSVGILQNPIGNCNNQRDRCCAGDQVPTGGSFAPGNQVSLTLSRFPMIVKK